MGNNIKGIELIKNILLDTIIVILAIVVICIVISAIQLNIKDQNYINIFGHSIFKVKTGSMEDTIKIGDIIIVKLTDNVKQNDIITYTKDNEFITHRIIKIDENSITTKGDNNNAEDEPIVKENVVGKVVFIVNNVEIWKKVFSDIKVIIPICITIILVIILIAYKEKIGENNVR